MAATNIRPSAGPVFDGPIKFCRHDSALKVTQASFRVKVVQTGGLGDGALANAILLGDGHM